MPSSTQRPRAGGDDWRPRILSCRNGSISKTIDPASSQIARTICKASGRSSWWSQNATCAVKSVSEPAATPFLPSRQWDARPQTSPRRAVRLPSVSPGRLYTAHITHDGARLETTGPFLKVTLVGIDGRRQQDKVGPFDAFPRIGHVPIDAPTSPPFSGSPAAGRCRLRNRPVAADAGSCQRAADQPDADNRHLFKMWCLRDMTADLSTPRRSSGSCGKGYSVRSTAAAIFRKSPINSLNFDGGIDSPHHWGTFGVGMHFDQQPIGPGRDRRLRHWRHRPICRLRGWIDDHRQMRQVFQRRGWPQDPACSDTAFRRCGCRARCNITLRLPRDMMYSADNRNSL